MNPWKLACVGSIALVAAVVVSCRPTVIVVAPGGVCGDQPNMANALSALRSARAYLEHAEHDKGGWRVRAIESTESAIRETERGCAFADTH
jgi:hypothetical protein